MSKSVDKKIIDQLVITLQEATVQKSSMFLIAEAMDMSIGEVMDLIDENDKNATLSKAYNKYQNVYKNYLLKYAMEEKVKMKEIILPLLKESGIIDAEDSGNDLELHLHVKGEEVEVTDISEETTKGELDLWEED